MSGDQTERENTLENIFTFVCITLSSLPPTIRMWLIEECFSGHQWQL